MDNKKPTTRWILAATVAALALAIILLQIAVSLRQGNAARVENVKVTILGAKPEKKLTVASLTEQFDGSFVYKCGKLFFRDYSFDFQIQAKSIYAIDLAQNGIRSIAFSNRLFTSVLVGTDATVVLDKPIRSESMMLADSFKILNEDRSALAKEEKIKHYFYNKVPEILASLGKETGYRGTYRNMDFIIEVSGKNYAAVDEIDGKLKEGCKGIFEEIFKKMGMKVHNVAIEFK